MVYNVWKRLVFPIFCTILFILDDNTRVILKDSATGDYINANYVNMPISGTDIVNKYIATQGPLPNTVEDFWQMILEQNCTLIVMLTTVLEKGRPKCHMYWPNVGEVVNLLNVSIKCLKEDSDPSGSYVFREMILIDLKVRIWFYNKLYLSINILYEILPFYILVF